MHSINGNYDNYSETVKISGAPGSEVLGFESWPCCFPTVCDLGQAI